MAFSPPEEGGFLRNGYPPKILRQLYDHPLTDKGLAAFLADWAKTGQSIL